MRSSALTLGLPLLAACASAPPPAAAPPPPPPVVATAAPAPPPPAVPAERTSAMIRPALAEMERAAYGCYVLEYAGQDQTGGLLVLDWVISAAGEVQSADIVETSFDSEAFAGCVLEAARGLKFPAAQRPSGVRKPYHFRRAEAETPKAAQL